METADDPSVAAAATLNDSRKEAQLHDLQRRELRCLGYELDLRARRMAVEEREAQLRRSRTVRAGRHDVEQLRLRLLELCSLETVQDFTSSEARDKLNSSVPAVDLARRAVDILSVLKGEKRVIKGQGSFNSVECLGTDLDDNFFSYSSRAGTSKEDGAEALSAEPAAGRLDKFDGLRFDLPGEMTLQQVTAQGGRCAGCGASLTSQRRGLRLGSTGPRACYYSGEMYCYKCHSGRKHPLPSRILQNWDFSPAQVCDQAYAHLKDLWSKPVVQLECVNAQLYSRVTKLRQAQRVRVQIVMLRKALKVLPPGLEEELDGFGHLLLDSDVYSMQDLVDLETRPAAYLARLRELLGRLSNISEERGGPPVQHLPEM